MELNDNIAKLCDELKLPTTIEEYHTVATTAAKESWTYVQFLNEILQLESSAKLIRVKTTLTKFAGFPAIKTLEQFDYNFSVGVNSKQIEELASLEFIKRNERATCRFPQK
jgi:DNA replication protein DnaC